MSVVVHITVGTEVLETIAIRRADGSESTDPDHQGVYEVRRFDRAGGGLRQLGDLQTVHHRYGDGAAALARAALNVAVPPT